MECVTSHSLIFDVFGFVLHPVSTAAASKTNVNRTANNFSFLGFILSPLDYPQIILELHR